MPSPSIVLIDDDRSSRTSMADYLRDEADFVVTDFAMAEDALTHLKAHHATCTAVVLDLILGPSGISGQEMLTRLNAQYPQLPVVIFTGRDPRGGIHALGQGAYANLQKPLDLAELITLIREIAGREIVFMQIAEDVRQLLNADLCIAWRLDRNDRQLRIAGWSGPLDNDYRTQIRLDVDEPLWRRFWQRDAPLFLPDLTDPRQGHYRHRPAALDRGWRSLITVPLLHAGHVIGLIDSYTLQPLLFASNAVRQQTMTMLRTFAHQATAAVRYTVLSQQNHLLQEINQVLADTLEEASVLQPILTKARESVGAAWGLLHLVDVESGMLTLARKSPESPELDPVILATSEAVALSAASTGVVQLEGKTGDTNFSIAAIPLRRGERTIGILTLISRQPAYFRSDDISFLYSLAALAAVAIERTKLASHLQEVSRMALTVTNFADLADYVAKAVRDLTGADVTLWMMSEQADEGDDWLRIRAHAGNVDFEFVAHAKLTVTPVESINARALQECRAIISPNITEDDNYYYQEVARRHGWRAYVAVPMYGREREPLGVLSLHDRAVNKFGEPDVQLVQTFANQAAVAFQQQRRVAAMQQLAEVGHNLAATMTEARTLLRQIASIARDLTRADCTVIYPYDPERQLFYQADAIAAVGLRAGTAGVSEKPRQFGLAATVRRFGIVVVENVDANKFQLGDKQICADDSAEFAKIFDDMHRAKFIQREGIKAFVGISLLAHGSRTSDAAEEVGVLYVNFRSLQYFTSEELQIIQIYAQHVANVIRNARLYERMEVLINVRTRALQQERERAAAAEKLAVSARLGAQFVHRVNNLGGTIPVRLNLAREQLNSQESREAAVIEELDRIAADLQDLLQAAEGIKHANESRTSEEVDINKLVVVAHERVWRSVTAQVAHITHTLALTAALPRITIDRTGLLDTFSNVIRNAVDAMPIGGALTITSALQQKEQLSYVVVVVTDTGTGIAAEDLPRVFDLFFTRKTSGWGFGLWHDKTFLNQYGGDIEVISIEGEGSTFSIWIPITSTTGGN